MTSKDDSMSLTDIAREAGVARQTAQRWHKGRTQRGKVTPSPLRAIAEAKGIEIPEADATRPRYPRSVVVAFWKAVGYMDAKGEFIPEIQEIVGRWLPVAPTIDPRPGARRRIYTNHIAEAMGTNTETVEMRRHRDETFPDPDDTDELGRSYWFGRTLNGYFRKKDPSVKF
ncbi:helix-turn-helix domain-containing protein [Streptomyces sp. NPDC090442]|uniref:helix-turn-helix domain-containing protein n=1 Tax=Streptomyces sp. NPDC090442 TaxID=3365962 RepID=UPI003816997D